MNWILSAVKTVSEEQLSALLAKLKDDAGLQEKLKGAADIDAAVAVAKEVGFHVSKADWLRHQAKQILELSDGDLEQASGGQYSDMCGPLHCMYTVLSIERCPVPH